MDKSAGKVVYIDCIGRDRIMLIKRGFASKVSIS